MPLTRPPLWLHDVVVGEGFFCARFWGSGVAFVWFEVWFEVWFGVPWVPGALPLFVVGGILCVVPAIGQGPYIRRDAGEGG